MAAGREITEIQGYSKTFGAKPPECPGHSHSLSLRENGQTVTKLLRQRAAVAVSSMFCNLNRLKRCKRKYSRHCVQFKGNCYKTISVFLMFALRLASGRLIVANTFCDLIFLIYSILTADYLKDNYAEQ